MKIREIRAAGLVGATPKGGWSNELEADDVVHTLIAVHTDEGVLGVGSVFTSEALVRASLDVLWPLVAGENPLEPERVSEKLHRATFWLGRGGAVTHTIGGIDIALWDIFGQVTGQPVGRLLGGRWRDRVTAYASVLMDEPAQTAETLAYGAAKEGPGGSRSAGGRLVGPVRPWTKPLLRVARNTLGRPYRIDGRRWSQRRPLGDRNSSGLVGLQTCWRTTTWPGSRSLCRPMPWAITSLLRAASSVPISGGEVFTRRQSFGPWIEAGALDIVQPDVTKVGGYRAAPDRVVRRGPQPSRHTAWLEYGRRAGVGPAICVRHAGY